MIFLAFVVPLAIYCFILSMLNRSRHPVMVAGPWDFAGVLLGSSGLLLLGGPAVLSGFYQQWRLAWILGRTRILTGLGDYWPIWVSLWIVYFALVVGAAGLVLWWRRNLTSIYNVDPVLFEDLLVSLLDRLGLETVRNGPYRVHLRARDPLTERWCTLRWDSFPLMRHVTLRWSGESNAIRANLEAELSRVLATVRSPDNPAAGWFMSLGVSLSLLVLFAVSGLLFLRVFQLVR